MEGAEEIGGDGDVVDCGGRFDSNDGHSVFIVSQRSCPAGRASCAECGHLRGGYTGFGGMVFCGPPVGRE